MNGGGHNWGPGGCGNLRDQHRALPRDSFNPHHERDREDSRAEWQTDNISYPIRPLSQEVQGTCEDVYGLGSDKGFKASYAAPQRQVKAYLMCKSEEARDSRRKYERGELSKQMPYAPLVTQGRDENSATV